MDRALARQTEVGCEVKVLQPDGTWKEGEVTAVRATPTNGVDFTVLYQDGVSERVYESWVEWVDPPPMED